MDNYLGTVYRPPVEAGTYLLPITEGCTHNCCSFCSMYQSIPFRMLSLEEVEKFLRDTVSKYPGYAESQKRVYFVGGDPFALSAEHLLERAALVQKYLPNVKEFTMYARVQNISSKSDEDLVRLRDAGINDLYLGLESGLEDVLEYMDKGCTLNDIRRECLRLNDAGIRHCDLLMFGTAGRGRGIEAARATAELENVIRPSQILYTTMTAYQGTRLNADVESGQFVLASEREILEEEIETIRMLDLPGTYFWAAHPLDAVCVDGDLGSAEEKEEMVQILTDALDSIDTVNVPRSGLSGNM